VEYEPFTGPSLCRGAISTVPNEPLEEKMAVTKKQRFVYVINYLLANVS
jgi:hypothetical protein